MLDVFYQRRSAHISFTVSGSSGTLVLKSQGSPGGSMGDRGSGGRVLYKAIEWLAVFGDSNSEMIPIPDLQRIES